MPKTYDVEVSNAKIHDDGRLVFDRQASRKIKEQGLRFLTFEGFDEIVDDLWLVDATLHKYTPHSRFENPRDTVEIRHERGRAVASVPDLEALGDPLDVAVEWFTTF